MRHLRLRPAIAFLVVAIASLPLSAKADHGHGGGGWHGGGGSWHGGGGWHGGYGYGPSIVIGPYPYPYYAPPPVYAVPPPAYYPPPAAYYPPPPPVAYAPQPVPQAGPVAQAGRFAVYFEFDHDQLTGTANAVVQGAASAYRAGGSPPISVVGYTDRAGTPSYNVALSQRRAETVRTALVRAGVPANAISIAWRGENDPQVPTQDGAREPQNRRVLILIGPGATS